jgi:hypothetical protein
MTFMPNKFMTNDYQNQSINRSGNGINGLCMTD